MSEVATRGSDWVPLRCIDLGRLKEARLQAHHAVQWLARAARVYVAPQPDDGHTNLGWDRALDGFTTHRWQDGAWLSLKITDLTLALHGSEAGADVKTFALGGRPDAQARQWLGAALDARGLDSRRLDTPSPYEMPPHAIAQGAAYDVAGLTDALAELAAWYDNAKLSLGTIQKQMIGRTTIGPAWAASPVRCWPHHFDLATLTTLPARDTGATGYVGAGLSPGDEYYDEPYFYVSVYPQPDPQTLPTLPMLGHWHGRDFMAAVATAHRIVAAKDQQGETDEFLHAAIDGAIKVFI